MEEVLLGEGRDAGEGLTARITRCCRLDWLLKDVEAIT